MKPDQFQRLLDKFSRGECTPEEEQIILDWYEKIGKEDDLANFPMPNTQEVESRLWTSLNPNRKPARRKTRLFYAWAAAITIPLLTFALIYYLNQKTLSPGSVTLSEVRADDSQTTLYKNDGRKAMKISLSDGSKVLLEPSSELSFTTDFNGPRREVRLTGEAFFDVKRDEEKPFLVYANEVVTRVLGTSFRVRAYENDKEVTVAVKTGKVSVYANKNKTARQVIQSDEVILSPNQQMVYNRVREVMSKTIVEEPKLLIADAEHFRMQFDNTAVSEIFDVLSRNYGIEIRYDETILEHCRLTTTMSEEGLYERIEVICKAIGASYAIDEDASIIIESDGCDPN